MKNSLVLFVTVLAALLTAIPSRAAATATDPAEAAKFALDYPEANWGPTSSEVAVQGAFSNEQIKQFIFDALKYAKMEVENAGPSLVIGSYKRGGVKYPAYIKYDTAHAEIHVNAGKYSASLADSIHRMLVEKFRAAPTAVPIPTDVLIPTAVTEISTPAQLAAINKDAAALRGNYLLMNDMTVDDWTPIGSGDAPFRGIFDGNGHTITIQRLHANDSQSRHPADTMSIGLFGTTASSALIKNLRVAGDLAYDSGAATLYMGAIAGENYGTISCCVSTANINAHGGKHSTGSGALEFVAAGAMGTRNRRVILAVQDEAAAGGIAGLNKKWIDNCYATGAVTATGEGFKVAGGIAGRNGFGNANRGIITRCYAMGNITAREDKATRTAGGITGLSMNGTITDCVALNGKLETIGKHKGIVVGGRGLSYMSNSAYGVIGENIATEITNAYYRKDMVIYMEKDDEAEKTDKNETGKNKSIFLSERGDEIDYAATQAQAWWQGAKPGITFAFGNDNAAPWVWDAGLNRPVLFWETPAGKQALHNAAIAKPRATAATVTPSAASGGSDAYAPDYPEANWGSKSCTVDVQGARTPEQVRQAIVETLKAYRWVVESNNDGLIIGSYRRGNEKYPVYVKYDSRHVDIYVNAGKNSKGWAENLRKTLDKKLGSAAG